MDVAALLIDDADADEVLVVRVDLAVTEGDRDCAAAILLTGPAHGETTPNRMNLMGEEPMKILDIDHVELYVGDAIAAAQSLCTAYGFRVYGHGGPGHGAAGPAQRLLGQGDIRVLLTSGLKEDHPASQFVAKHGDGVAVTAFGTDNAAIAYTDAVAAGGFWHPSAPHLGERRGQRRHRGGRGLR